MPVEKFIRRNLIFGFLGLFLGYYLLFQGYFGIDYHFFVALPFDALVQYIMIFIAGAFMMTFGINYLLSANFYKRMDKATISKLDNAGKEYTKKMYNIRVLVVVFIAALIEYLVFQYMDPISKIFSSLLVACIMTVYLTKKVLPAKN